MTAKPSNAPMKIALCFPSGPMVHVDFMISTALMMQQTPNVDFILINNKSPNISVSRNACVAMAQEAQADYLFFLDSDMDVPPDTITRFLSHNKDIIGANYSKRLEEFSLAGNEIVEKPEDLVDHGLLPAVFIPTGCLLIKMSVFDNLPKPYFFFGLREYEDKDERAIFGEDFVFSVKVRSSGYELWFDMDVTQKVKHIGQLPYKMNGI
ncbi:MAG: glycosyltransferase [Zymomonas mobilis]|uniref:Glycosyl transferase family 21 n=1 Tax=Zymomonas mobilis TaxID=542 RepID=A0A542W0N0_ZYMMB|nr:glycosyltransferase [Zymomonas mobilis]TQL17093.1 glycosyl transferase family 21 [Zymomonas mobilis]